VTRDGTFLIENGKVTKAIKNLRFLDSPFFVLNKVDAFGTPERAVGSEGLIAVPRLKVHDFEFIGLSDAV
jgi:predicted Zn-dependent protease